MLQGNLVINNSSGTVKRYKYIAGHNGVEGTQTSVTYFDRSGIGVFWENIIYAVPTN
ncbi:hypothetical protein PYS58_12300 [Chryseobacterium indologenes]|uniref:hypothetical protein n=1 Tax=Chryseobacterium indologenes TaxID=253 RepID=UPI0023E7E586|nr:hypothetical protein [Chryseobacterium indologenes]WET47367.1 hypothetical protein PYS58_12300 [Chryseobacterium indologenes]